MIGAPLFGFLSNRWLTESAWWLVAKRKTKAAHYYIRNCAETNNRSKCIAAITPKTLLEFAEADTGDQRYTIVDLFRTPNIKKFAVCSGIVWQNGLGYTSFVARLGVSISPLVMLLVDVWQFLPAATYCAVAIGSGLVASLLPETLNTQLPELIEDIEKPRSKSTRKMEIQ
ncbi:hypothetical protein ATANTOWER_002736 [Ataeniobius toweri]|uniref:Uncharacterized protein n=1 Tax=Ataeniobius toweri TaxID=208326 RepID=A0ABU7A0S5_9TELE|nr:hypothetical protein [Ataeniobius toweri]